MIDVRNLQQKQGLRMEETGTGNTGMVASRLMYGCMRLSEIGDNEGFEAIEAALRAGYTHFDHADIYGGGESERLFGKYLRQNPGLRDDIVITSKCGIRFAGDPDADSPKRYDFTAAHILKSVDRSLERLNIEHLDVLLLHRPDYLMRADEVADAFAKLTATGKVRNFGVSNFTTSQVDLLMSRLPAGLCANQLEINIQNLSAFEDGTLEQCQQRRMTPQAWSPLAGIVHSGWGVQLDPDTRARIRAEIDRQENTYKRADWLVMLAWLMKHPADISPIIGSTSPERIRAATEALDIDYQRDDWYRLLEARVGEPVP